jgi:hypothetical protein
MERDIEVAELRGLLKDRRPSLVLCFGQFSFEFALHARLEAEKCPQRWTVRSVKTLAKQFEETIPTIQPDSVNVLPLLHAIAARQFRHCHKEFSGGQGNYFEYVGKEIALVLIKHRTHPSFSNLAWM